MANKPLTRPEWTARPAVVIAGGYSLNDEQLHAVGDARQHNLVRVIGVNNAYLRAPWVDAIFACDFMWWKRHHGEIKSRHLPAETVTQDAPAHKTFGLTTRVRGSAGNGLGTFEIHTGGNGGHGAVNLAYLWGARTILLLGFDMHLGPNGERHWHRDHESPLIQQQNFAEWIHRFKSTAADLQKHGVTVLNCTPDSSLPWFERCSIEHALETMAKAPA